VACELAPWVAGQPNLALSSVATASFRAGPAVGCPRQAFVWTIQRSEEAPMRVSDRKATPVNSRIWLMLVGRPHQLRPSSHQEARAANI
jgi:hypothetical protein